jgi:hypothetical protein
VHCVKLASQSVSSYFCITYYLLKLGGIVTVDMGTLSVKGHTESISVIFLQLSFSWAAVRKYSTHYVPYMWNRYSLYYFLSTAEECRLVSNIEKFCGKQYSIVEDTYFTNVLCNLTYITALDIYFLLILYLDS